MVLIVTSYLSDQAQEALKETWPSQITHVSASSMKMLARCPEQYRQVYILGKRQRPGQEAVWGRADHAAIEWSLREKLDKGKAPSTQDVENRFAHELGVAIETDGGMGEIIWSGSPHVERDEILRKGSVLAGEYARVAVPQIVPVTVEESFTIDIGLPCEVVGRIDLIGHYEHEDESQLRIIERKTSAKKMNRPAPDWVAQARIYQMVERLPHDWHVSIKQVTPRIQLREPGLTLAQPPGLDTERTWLRRMVALVASLFNTYGPDQDWPGFGTSHPWACGFCGFRNDCTFQKGGMYKVAPRGDDR